MEQPSTRVTEATQSWKVSASGTIAATDFQDGGMRPRTRVEERVYALFALWLPHLNHGLNTTVCAHSRSIKIAGNVDMSDDSLLVVALDTSAVGWHALHAAQAPGTFASPDEVRPPSLHRLSAPRHSSGEWGEQLFAHSVDSVLTLLNAHLALSQGNQIAVLAYQPGAADFVYTEDTVASAAPATLAAAPAPRLAAMNAAVREHAARVLAACPASDGGAVPSVAAVLTKALCCTSFVRRAPRRAAFSFSVVDGWLADIHRRRKARSVAEGSPPTRALEGHSSGAWP